MTVQGHSSKHYQISIEPFEAYSLTPLTGQMEENRRSQLECFHIWPCIKQCLPCWELNCSQLQEELLPRCKVSSQPLSTSSSIHSLPHPISPALCNLTSPNNPLSLQHTTKHLHHSTLRAGQWCLEPHQHGKLGVTAVLLQCCYDGVNMFGLLWGKTVPSKVCYHVALSGAGGKGGYKIGRRVWMGKWKGAIGQRLEVSKIQVQSCRT